MHTEDDTTEVLKELSHIVASCCFAKSTKEHHIAQRAINVIERLLEKTEMIDRKFTSRNDCEVERVTVRRGEWSGEPK